MGPIVRSSNDSHSWLDEALEANLDDPSATVIFAHEGPVEHDTIRHLVERAETWSLGSEDGVSTRKRLVNILVEGLENLHHHTLRTRRDMAYSFLVRDRRGYRIAFANAVPQVSAALLTHRIAILNEMDEADMKEHYLKLLSNDRRSMHGGAGLGLLTIARKSSARLVASTRRICQESCLFGLQAQVEA